VESIVRHTAKNDFLTRVLIAIGVVVMVTLCTSLSQAETPPDWYRIRTNSIPHQPNNVIVDAQGGVWVTAEDGTESEPGVWYHAPAAGPGDFQYITNKLRNNYQTTANSTLVEKPELDASVLYATQDSQENTWYALKNRTVLCEKADGNWLTFTIYVGFLGQHVVH